MAEKGKIAVKKQFFFFLGGGGEKGGKGVGKIKIFSQTRKAKWC